MVFQMKFTQNSSASADPVLTDLQPQDIVNHVLEGQKDLPGDLDVNNFKIAIRRALAKARSKE